VTERPFYLYRIFYGDMLLYIGKGSGRRLESQKRAFGVDGEIIARYDDEDKCFAAEKRLIARLDPPLNRHPGGCGGRLGQQIREIPNGLTEEGLPYAAPQLARLVLLAHRRPDLGGLLRILEPFLNAHGFERLADAVVPHIKRLQISRLALQNKP
jgi:hypothetical protein